MPGGKQSWSSLCRRAKSFASYPRVVMSMLEGVYKKKGPSARTGPRISIRGLQLTALLQLHRHRLHFRVIRQSIFAEFAAQPRLLEPAKRGRGIEHVVAIHPHGSGAHAIRY